MSLKLNSIQLDILKRHVGPFVICFFTIMFLLLMQFLILHIDKLVGKGLPLTVILELIVTNLAYMVVLAAPMSVLVGSLMAFGRYAEYNELSSLMAAGINPIRLMNPVIVASVLLSFTLIWFSNNVLPDANQRARSLFIDIRMKKPGFDLKENVFYDGIDGYRFLVKKISSETDSLYDVTIFQTASRNRNKAIIRADKGMLQSAGRQTLTLNLYNGSILRFLPSQQSRTQTYEKTNYDRYRIRFDLSEFTFSRSNPDRRQRSDRTMTSQAMLAVVDSLRQEIEQEKDRYAKKIDRIFEKIDTDSIDQVNATVSGHDSVSDKHALQGRGNKHSGASGNDNNRGNLFARQKADSKNTATQTDTAIPRSDTSAVQTASPTRDDYYAIELLSSISEQRSLISTSLTSLRDIRSNYENLSSGTEWRRSRIAQFLVEVHKKVSIPIACIVFVLLGAPLGMYARKGNLGYAAVISAGLLTFYWISIIQGEKLADRLFISPAMGMWFSNAILGLAGIMMTVYITTPVRQWLRRPKTPKRAQD